MRVHILQLAGSLFMAALIGCGDTSEATQDTTLPTEVECFSGPCLVTLPNGSQPPDEEPPDGARWAHGVTPDRAPVNHENGEIWVSLWAEGMVVFRPGGPGRIYPAGGLEMKFPWWRGISGALTIEGRRLDAPGQLVPHTYDGNQDSIGFVPTSTTFREGCWEVTGSVGDASLTFVTLVVKEGN